MRFLSGKLGGFFCIAVMLSVGIFAADGRPVHIELKPLSWEVPIGANVTPLTCVARKWAITYEDSYCKKAFDTSVVQTALAALPIEVKKSIQREGACCFFGRLSRSGTDFVSAKSTTCLIFIVNSKCAVFNLQGESLLKNFGDKASDAYSLKESLNFEAFFCTTFLPDMVVVSGAVGAMNSFSDVPAVCRRPVSSKFVRPNAGSFDYRNGGFASLSKAPVTAGDFVVSDMPASFSHAGLRASPMVERVSFSFPGGELSGDHLAVTRQLATTVVGGATSDDVVSWSRIASSAPMLVPSDEDLAVLQKKCGDFWVISRELQELGCESRFREVLAALPDEIRSIICASRTQCFFCHLVRSSPAGSTRKSLLLNCLLLLTEDGLYMFNSEPGYSDWKNLLETEPGKALPFVGTFESITLRVFLSAVIGPCLATDVLTIKS
ncbi:MAG: hypothetical protein QG632_332 [Candidatus Dependentiae bacterium]|nr:hypothetical protein [Candidatus Dependentiae bacterium]